MMNRFMCLLDSKMITIQWVYQTLYIYITDRVTWRTYSWDCYKCVDCVDSWCVSPQTSIKCAVLTDGQSWTKEVFVSYIHLCTVTLDMRCVRDVLLRSVGGFHASPPHLNVCLTLSPTPENSSELRTRKRRSLVDFSLWVRDAVISARLIVLMNVNPSFSVLGLSYPVFKGVMKKGYKVPTPIQRKVRNECRVWCRVS